MKQRNRSRRALAVVGVFVAFLNVASASRPLNFDENLQSLHSTPFQDDFHLNLEHQRHLNLRPLVGIVSQGGEPAPEGHSYIAASYIKFVSAAGARAVPILHDMPADEIKRRFRAVNAVLLPGGAQDLRPGNPYFDTSALLFNLTIEANDAGDYFPVSLFAFLEVLHEHMV
jgi:hypothetical protein